uniref:Reverse transcriptase zinc-binding domain-containing protein n=1 Tax=Cannabis sativa TaxID=3483 RepID=A0A803PLS1_CANSA
MLWTAVQDRLRTRARLKQMKIISDDCCLFCSNHSETKNHLFFSCIFATQCLLQIKSWLHWRIESVDLDVILRWIERSNKGRAEFIGEVSPFGLANMHESRFKVRASVIEWNRVGFFHCQVMAQNETIVRFLLGDVSGVGRLDNEGKQIRDLREQHARLVSILVLSTLPVVPLDVVIYVKPTYEQIRERKLNESPIMGQNKKVLGGPE